MHALFSELAMTALFLAAVVVGFKRNLWIVAAALLGHGLMDFVHGQLISNPGVPAFWPAFCASFDITAAAWLAGVLGVRNLARPVSVVA